MNRRLSCLKGVLCYFGMCLAFIPTVFPQEHRVTIRLQNGTLPELFKVIREQTNCDFIYDSELVREAQRISLNIEDASLDDVLKKTLKNQDLSYTIDNNTVIVKNSGPNRNPTVNEKQEKFSFSGRVIEDASGVELAGATIRLHSSTAKFATKTDSEGRFSLGQITPGTYNFQVSMIGYNTVYQSITIQSNKQLSEPIRLLVISGELDQVVVTAYGNSKVRDITGSIARVTSKDLETSQMGATVQSALQGRAPGVNVVIQSASPTSPISVVIRGASSLSGSNQPLWVIDGVPDYSNSTSGNIENTLYNLNLNDVESIDILKDASATALYGSRAANGVVIVSTKKGVANMSPMIEFTNRFGYFKQDFNGFKYMNTDDYKAFSIAASIEEAFNRGAFDNFTRRYLDELSFLRLNTSEFDKSNYKVHPDAFHSGNTDWIREMTTSPWNKDYDLGLRGGTNNLVYYVALNHSNYQGVIKGGLSKQFGGRINMEAKLNKGLKFGFNLNASTRKTDNKDELLDIIYRIRPDLPMYNEDGTIYTKDFYTENPLTTLANLREGRSENFTGTGFFEWQAFQSLIVRTAYTAGYANTQNLTFNRRGTSYTTDANRSWRTSRNITSVWENTATYARTFGKHDVLAMAGFSMESFKGNTYGMFASKFPDDEILTNFASAAVRGSLSEDYYRNALVSQFARMHYKFNEKYIISGTVRRDGSSKFGPGRRWGIFPSTALAWLIHEENFIKNSFANHISYLKLRMSTGRAGSQNLGNYDWITRIGSTTYNDLPAIVPRTLGNINLQWEQANLTDFGIDYGVWNERIRGTIGYYSKVTDHLINNQPIPYSSSFTNISANVATMKNVGVEFDVTTDILKAEHATFSLNFNISSNKTFLKKINDLVKDVTFSDMMHIKEGERVGQWYGYKTHGRFFVTQEEIVALKSRQENGSIGPYRNGLEAVGDLFFQDLNGDGKITQEDRTIIGNADPKFFGGFGATLLYRGLRINSQFIYSYGGRRLWQLPQTNVGNTGNYNQSYQIGGQSATILNPYIATMPRALPYGDGDNQAFSDFWLYDASFLRLGALNISFRLPGRYFGENLLQGIDLGLQATNLFTITRYPGFDPQGNWVSSRVGIGMGLDSSIYPAARTYNLSAKFTFK